MPETLLPEIICLISIATAGNEYLQVFVFQLIYIGLQGRGDASQVPAREVLLVALAPILVIKGKHFFHRLAGEDIACSCTKLYLTAMARKSWVEKRNLARPAQVKVTDKAFADIPAGSTMLIATPEIVHDYVKQIPRGNAASLAQMRKDLAAEYGAQYMCPVTAGIFLRIVAEAAWEELQQGKPIRQVAPFWRIIPLKSPTAKKLSFGTEWLAAQRKAEGIADPTK